MHATDTQPAAGMQYTPQQTAFHNAVALGADNIMLEACAGSGKTTGALVPAVAKAQRRDTLCVAFNRRIAEELAQRMPEWAECRTMNALGHRSVIRGLGRRSVRLTSWKYHDVLKALGVAPGAMPDLPRLISAARGIGLAPATLPMRPRGLTEDSDATWCALIDHYGLDLGDTDEARAIEIAREALSAGTARAFSEGLIDFDDQLYLPAIYNFPLDPRSLVLIDEAQDISAVQRALLKRIAHRLAAVGDRHQAIYGFRGADADSIANIVSEFRAVEMPLTISFRCPRRVVEFASQWAPHIEAAPTAPPGAVTTWRTWSLSDIRPGDAVLCRYNAPLVSLAFRLLRNRVPVRMLGREIGEHMQRLIRKIAAGADMPMTDFLPRLAEWTEAESAAARRKRQEARADAIEDKAASIEALAEGTRTVEELLQIVNTLFSDATAARVVLSTIHKAKGLEWPRVIWLNGGASQMPRWIPRGGWQEQQEYNLCYVAATRAREELILASTSRLRERGAEQERQGQETDPGETPGENPEENPEENPNEQA